MSHLERDLSVELVPTEMDMEDAVREMDRSNLSSSAQRTINLMREALIEVRRVRRISNK